MSIELGKSEKLEEELKQDEIVESKDKSASTEIKKRIQRKKKKKVKDLSFNPCAFLFTGSYLIATSKYALGVITLIVTSAISLKWYFFIGLCCGFIVPRNRSGISVLSIVLSCLSAIVFVILKLVRLYYLGGF
jgi:hypothetical protein